MGKNLKRVGYVEIALIGLRQAKLEAGELTYEVVEK
jgi:hypothetical protein